MIWITTQKLKAPECTHQTKYQGNQLMKCQKSNQSNKLLHYSLFTFSHVKPFHFSLIFVFKLEPRQRSVRCRQITQFAGARWNRWFVDVQTKKISVCMSVSWRSYSLKWWYTVQKTSIQSCLSFIVRSTPSRSVFCHLINNNLLSGFHLFVRIVFCHCNCSIAFYKTTATKQQSTIRFVIRRLVWDWR